MLGGFALPRLLLGARCLTGLLLVWGLLLLLLVLGRRVVALLLVHGVRRLLLLLHGEVSFSGVNDRPKVACHDPKHAATSGC